MPPRANSRHLLVSGVFNSDGKRFLTDRVRYFYRSLPDTIVHTALAGDTWHSIAGRYYADLPRGAGYWWAVADFQPDPVFDPTLEIVPGAKVYVPSVQTLLTRILSETRRGEEPT